MSDAREYTYRVFWSDEDNGFVATVAEFPSLSCCETSQDRALRGIVDVVSAALELLAQDGREAPVPLGRRRYSGHLSLRIPPEKHRRVAIEAAEEGVSINQLICSRI